jgi:three-Cys-motif partner protein
MHTDDKLSRLRQYLAAYCTALKHQRFVLVYVDAFAGSGDRTHVLPALPLLAGADAEPQVLSVPGSARIALEIDPSFDVFVLIENDQQRYAQLEKLRSEYPNKKIHCHPGDANEAVQRLCRTLPWSGSAEIPRGMRAVVFLDPYGMEVSWDTVVSIAKTEAIDLWYFFPLMGLYRQAARDVVDIDDIKRLRLNTILGTTDWEDAWYSKPQIEYNLFDDPASSIRTADVNAIERYVKERLRSAFKGDVLEPLRIRNERGAPLASLFFAVSNPNSRAVKVATDIARYILASGKSSHVRPR